MASQHVTVKNGSRGSGGRHANYIAGNDRYADRSDVRYVEDGNLPDWASDAADFFAAADELERGSSKQIEVKDRHGRPVLDDDGKPVTKETKGRSYKELEVAIPREAQDPVKWAKDYTREMIGDKHPYRMAVHDKEASDGGRNVHMHLMFSTREMDGYKRDRETFFKRANTGTYKRDGKTYQHAPGSGGARKSAFWNSRDSVKHARATFERHVQRVAPGFKLERSDAPEPKIGPKLAKAGPEYDRQRKERAAIVGELREAKRERRDLDAEIKREQEIENRLTKAKEAGELERKQSAPSLVDTSTGIEQAKREQAQKPPGRTDELFAQMEARLKKREADRKEQENPLAEILKQRQERAEQAGQKPEDQPKEKDGQKMFEHKQEGMSQESMQQPEQQQAPEQQTQQPERSRTDELFAQLERQQQEREQRDRDGGPELSR